MPAPDNIPAEPDDRALCAQARRGDRSAFDTLVHRYHDRLFAFLRQRTGDDHDAIELTQEALFKAWTSIDRYDPAYAFSTWLFTIGSRLAISRIRRRFSPQMRRRIADTIAARSSDDHTDPINRVATHEQRDNLWALADRVLTETERAALWLRYAEDLSGAIIAEVLGVSHTNVRVLLHRARGKLRTALEAFDTLEAPRSTGHLNYA